MASDLSLMDAFREAVRIAGSQPKFARICGCTQGNISQLLRANRPLSSKYVLAVEAETGISRHALRPDIYGPAPDADIAAAATPIARAPVAELLTTPGGDSPRAAWSDVQLGERVR